MGDPTDLPDSPYEPAEVAISPRERPMGFLEHLEELRWTLVKCAIVFALFAVGIGFFIKEFNQALLWPLRQGSTPGAELDLGTIGIMEGFSVVLQMCFMGGLVMSAPFILLFVGQFVAPALHDREIKLLLPGCIGAFILFLAGAAFSFFLLVPNTIRVALEVNEWFGFVQRWTPGNYYSLLSWLVLGVGVAFEFPMVILILVYLGVVSAQRLRSWRKHAVIVFFIVAAVVTPTPDPITQSALAVPLYLLYELSLFGAAQIEKRRPPLET